MYTFEVSNFHVPLHFCLPIFRSILFAKMMTSDEKWLVGVFRPRCFI